MYKIIKWYSILESIFFFIIFVFRSFDKSWFILIFAFWPMSSWFLPSLHIGSIILKKKKSERIRSNCILFCIRFKVLSIEPFYKINNNNTKLGHFAFIHKLLYRILFILNTFLLCRERLRMCQSMNSTGKLQLADGESYDFTAEDLQDLGEIGRGAFGAVNKMVHRRRVLCCI